MSGAALRFTAVFVFLCSSLLFAQNAAKASVPLRIDTQRSKITLHVFRGGLFSFAGDNHEIAAPIANGTVDQAERKVELQVHAADLQVQDPKASAETRAKVQQRMLSPDVLDVQRFPVIAFHSTAVEAQPDGSWRVRGELELHGQHRELTFPVTEKDGAFQGSTQLRQSDFGIKPISIAGGSVKVKDELKVEFLIYAAH
jgi:polyisoprenoid-binding protein YceI